MERWFCHLKELDPAPGQPAPNELLPGRVISTFGPSRYRSMFVGEAHSVDRSSGKIARAKASVTFTGKKKMGAQARETDAR